MGFLSKLTGADRLRAAGRSRMKAARIELRAPDYNQVTGTARDTWANIGERWAKENRMSLESAYGKIGGTFSAAGKKMDTLYGDARGMLSENFDAQRSDIRQSSMLNSRALGSYGGQALGAISGPGGSLQARFAGAMDVQNQIGQQMLQGQAQSMDALNAARGNFMNLSAGLYSDQANMTGQMASQQAGMEAQLAGQFGQLDAQGRMQAAEMGFQQGQADYGNQMQEAILRRQIEQEPYLTDAQNQMSRAQHRMGLLNAGIGLASAIPGLGSAFASIGKGVLGATTQAGGGIGQFLGSLIPGGQSPFGGNWLPGDQAGPTQGYGGGGWGDMMRSFQSSGQSFMGGLTGGYNSLMNAGQPNQVNSDWYTSTMNQLNGMGAPQFQMGGGNPWDGFGGPQDAYQYGLSGGQAGPVGGGYGYQGFAVRPPWAQ